MKKHKSSLKGFSLLEVMISGTIFLTALAGVITAHSAMMRSFNHQLNITQVIYVAEAQMEEILSFPSSSSLLAAGVEHGPSHFNEKGDRTTSANKYEVIWEVEPHPEVSRAKRVEVTVKWEEDGQPKEFVLKTERT